VASCLKDKKHRHCVQSDVHLYTDDPAGSCFCGFFLAGAVYLRVRLLSTNSLFYEFGCQYH